MVHCTKHNLIFAEQNVVIKNILHIVCDNVAIESKWHLNFLSLRYFVRLNPYILYDQYRCVISASPVASWQKLRGCSSLSCLYNFIIHCLLDTCV